MSMTLKQMASVLTQQQNAVLKKSNLFHTTDCSLQRNRILTLLIWVATK